MNTHRPGSRLVIGLLTAAIAIAACSSATAPSLAPSPPGGAPPASGQPPDTQVSAAPSDGMGQPIEPGAKLVFPKPGQLDVHDIPADSLAARVEGSSIIVTATWTSGVEPCSVLDSIVVAQGTGAYSITLREGHGPEEIACIAIAEQHRTEFDIPNVAPGTYTVADTGGLAPPIQVTVG